MSEKSNKKPSETLKNIGFKLMDTSIGKLLYGEKIRDKVIHKDVFEKRIEEKPKSTPKKEEKPIPETKKPFEKKFWYHSNWVQETKTIGGKVCSFRSSWEVRVAYYLQLIKSNGLIRDWFFEPDKFYFEKVKRGLKAYIPDFKVIFNDGSYEYWEVKGFLDSKAKTKLKRFEKYYPHLVLRVLNKEWFDSIKEKGIKIEGWD